MPMSNVPTAYPDCFAFCEKCVDDDVGARKAFKEEGGAMQFRNRCNYFRILTRRENARIYPEEDKRHGTSDYDAIAFTIRQGADGWWWVYGRKLALGEEDIESLSQVEAAAVNETPS